MDAEYKQTFITDLRCYMAVTASIFFSPIFKCVIQVFCLPQTIFKILYWNIWVYDISSQNTCITLSAFTQKSLILHTEQQICFSVHYHN